MSSLQLMGALYFTRDASHKSTEWYIYLPSMSPHRETHNDHWCPDEYYWSDHTLCLLRKTGLIWSFLSLITQLSYINHLLLLMLDFLQESLMCMYQNTKTTGDWSRPTLSQSVPQYKSALMCLHKKKRFVKTSCVRTKKIQKYFVEDLSQEDIFCSSWMMYELC